MEFDRGSEVVVSFLNIHVKAASGIHKSLIGSINTRKLGKRGVSEIVHKLHVEIPHRRNNQYNKEDQQKPL